MYVCILCYKVSAAPQIADMQVAVLWAPSHIVSVSLNGNINLFDPATPDPVRVLQANQVTYLQYLLYVFYSTYSMATKRCLRLFRTCRCQYRHCVCISLPCLFSAVSQITSHSKVLFSNLLFLCCGVCTCRLGGWRCVPPQPCRPRFRGCHSVHRQR